ncbi:Alpha-tubulin N-acetyltransferase 1 [Pseudolycoriella hygida]|uniref:Alpha-tubulin N-acetyltransferase 1 n=1 Tax=Pseudolycoriella hygida TaxID=35572 RepID=A0A9Q0N4K5_9DIPT|nr:Alpha-tubulin N-acetyltransferase 1 [Pseudolycoriella hygida]
MTISSSTVQAKKKVYLSNNNFELLKDFARNREFRFNLAPLFKTDIIKVDNNLVPLGFHGDKRTILDTTTKITEIINEMGESSARAQGLTRAVTTAQKLRNSDQVVYLLRENIGKNTATIVYVTAISNKEFCLKTKSRACVACILRAIRVRNIFVKSKKTDVESLAQPRKQVKCY